MTAIGYARVSTSGQTLDAQLEQLGGAGCARVFRETMSGARSDRPQLMAALKALEAGDTLIITRLRPRRHCGQYPRQCTGRRKPATADQAIG